MVRVAGGHHPPVQLMDLAAGAASGNGQGDEYMLRCASHRCNVAEVRGGGAESDVGHRGGSKVEVDPFC